MSDTVWKAVYASAAGTSHKGSSLPCQDAWSVANLRTSSDGVAFVACVADGAGSASHADVGARIVADTFMQIAARELSAVDLGENIDRKYLSGWLGEIRLAVDQRASELNVERRELASTLLGCVIGESKSLFVQIGDGAIVIGDGSEYSPVFWPQSGEFANTTNFLTDTHYDERFEWQWWDKRVDEVALFSDGLERLILRFADHSVHTPFLKPFFSVLRQAATAEAYFEPLRAFLDSAKVNERTDDDKTLVLATRLHPLISDDAIR